MDGFNNTTASLERLVESSRYFDAVVRFNRQQPENVRRHSIVIDEQVYSEAIRFLLSLLCESSHASLCSSRSSPNYSLDFVFDVVLMSSKYFLLEYEHIYSDLFVDILKQHTADIGVAEIVLPRQEKVSHSQRALFATSLEMKRAATIFNLDYLAGRLCEHISHRRSFYIQQLRNLYFW